MRSNQGDTQLFLLRIWLEEAPQAGGENEVEAREQQAALRWRGKVQHVVRGEAHAFTGWQMMIDYLETLLVSEQADSGEARRS
jgi:hypothetical protein